jgi:hypothetical protein
VDGAAVTEEVFPGFRFSVYSFVVSLLHPEAIRDLDLPRPCKRRGFCLACEDRRMAETSAHLVDHIIPWVPVWQWVVSFPIRLPRLGTDQQGHGRIGGRTRKAGMRPLCGRLQMARSQADTDSTRFSPEPAPSFGPRWPETPKRP